MRKRKRHRKVNLGWDVDAHVPVARRAVQEGEAFLVQAKASLGQHNCPIAIMHFGAASRRLGVAQTNEAAGMNWDTRKRLEALDRQLVWFQNLLGDKCK